MMASIALGEIAEINPKGPGKQELAPDQLLDFVPMADVSERGGMQASKRRAYREVSTGFTAFRDRDVLLAKITPCFENNKIALARVSTPYAFGSTEFHVIRGKPKKVLPEYLTYFLRQDRIRYAGERRMTGSAGQRRVPKAFLEELEVPLPSLEEQKRIVSILDQADTLRRLRQRAIDRLNTLGQAIFNDMFGDLARNDQNWPLIKCKEVLKLTGGFAFKSANYTEDGIPLVRIGEVNTNFHKASVFHPEDKSLERYLLRKNDLVISLTGTVGKNDYCNTALVPDTFEKFYLNQRVAKISCDTKKLSSVFFQFLISQPEFKSEVIKNNRGIRQANISNRDIYQLEIPLPPKQLQDDFSKRIFLIDAQREVMLRSMEQVEDLFVSVQHGAFRGEL